MVSDDIRRRLCTFARSRRTRTSLFSPVRPTHWSPYSVRCPDTLGTFNSDSCWQFVVDMIEGGADMWPVLLEKPPGTTAYVMLADGFEGERIYIKLQLGGDQVIGRSFHVSLDEDRT